MRIPIDIDDSWNVSYFSALMQEQKVLLPPGIPLFVLRVGYEPSIDRYPIDLVQELGYDYIFSAIGALDEDE
jgi:hypothetical protein